MNPSNHEENKYTKGSTPKCWNEQLPHVSHLGALGYSEYEQGAINRIPAYPTHDASVQPGSRFPWAEITQLQTKIVPAKSVAKYLPTNRLFGLSNARSPIIDSTRVTFTSDGVQRVQKNFNQDYRLN